MIWKVCRRPVGQGKNLDEHVSVARVRPRTSKGITDLLLPRTSCSLQSQSPSKKLIPRVNTGKLFSRSRSRSLTELTRQITPPTKNGHAPPPIESRKIFNLSILTMSGPGKFSRVESNYISYRTVYLNNSSFSRLPVQGLQTETGFRQGLARTLSRPPLIKREKDYRHLTARYTGSLIIIIKRTQLGISRLKPSPIQVVLPLWVLHFSYPIVD